MRGESKERMSDCVEAWGWCVLGKGVLMYVQDRNQGQVLLERKGSSCKGGFGLLRHFPRDPGGLCSWENMITDFAA